MQSRVLVPFESWVRIVELQYYGQDRMQNNMNCESSQLSKEWEVNMVLSTPQTELSNGQFNGLPDLLTFRLLISALNQQHL